MKRKEKLNCISKIDLHEMIVIKANSAILFCSIKVLNAL